MFILYVFLAFNELSQDREAILGGPTLAGGRQATTDFRMAFLGCQFDELRLYGRSCYVVIPQKANGPETDKRMRMVECF